jgi:hypothetical protein
MQTFLIIDSCGEIAEDAKWIENEGQKNIKTVAFDGNNNVLCTAYKTGNGCKY